MFKDGVGQKKLFGWFPGSRSSPAVLYHGVSAGGWCDRGTTYHLALVSSPTKITGISPPDNVQDCSRGHYWVFFFLRSLNFLQVVAASKRVEKDLCLKNAASPTALFLWGKKGPQSCTI